MPVPHFRASSLLQAGASQQEIDDYLGKMPQMPKLYTITELNEG